VDRRRSRYKETVAFFRILSFDGGGIRGLLSTLLLQRLIDDSAMSELLDSVDMFAGTSTGGLIALGLASEIPLNEIKNLYLEDGPNIFSENFFDQIRDVGNLLGPQYSNRQLRRSLLDIFGDKKLGDLKRRVMVPAFELDNLKDMRPGESRRWKAKIFHNLPNREADKDRLLRDVALYTCSAPTYFPVADGFIDGAVFANNPSLCAIAQALDKRWRSHPRLSDIRLLSIGSGHRIAYLEGGEHHWGVVQWGAKIIPILMEASQETTHFQCLQILGESQYCRIQPMFYEDYRMDSVDQIPEMMDFALKSVNLTRAVEWVRQNWRHNGWMNILRQNHSKRKYS
jgi:uncharacterized protein